MAVAFDAWPSIGLLRLEDITREAREFFKRLMSAARLPLHCRKVHYEKQMPDRSVLAHRSCGFSRSCRQCFGAGSFLSG
jgi:hypothetical protein